MFGQSYSDSAGIIHPRILRSLCPFKYSVVPFLVIEGCLHLILPLAVVERTEDRACLDCITRFTKLFEQVSLRSCPKK